MKQIDDVIDLRTDNVIQLLGDESSGKSSICLLYCIATQFQSQQSIEGKEIIPNDLQLFESIFIDAKKSVCPKYLSVLCQTFSQQLLKNFQSSKLSQEFISQYSLQLMFSRIKYCNVSYDGELLILMDNIEKYITKQTKLIVLDGLYILLKNFFPEFQFLKQLGARLQQLAYKFNLAVLLTNTYTSSSKVYFSDIFTNLSTNTIYLKSEPGNIIYLSNEMSQEECRVCLKPEKLDFFSKQKI